MPVDARLDKPIFTIGLQGRNKRATYVKARAARLEGKGYTIK